MVQAESLASTLGGEGAPGLGRELGASGSSSPGDLIPPWAWQVAAQLQE